MPGHVLRHLSRLFPGPGAARSGVSRLVRSPVLALVLVIGTVGGEHFHIARVGGSGSKELGRGGVFAEDLVHASAFQLSESRPPELLLKEKRPQPLILHTLLEFA